MPQLRHLVAALVPPHLHNFLEIATNQARHEACVRAGTLEPANDPATTPCVLVVDDEPTLRRLMRRALSGIGVDVVEAANGLEALEQLQTRDVVAVVSDVRMPLMDGLELVEQLQSRAPNVPIVLVSGSDEVTTRAGAQALGAFDFLAKPFDLFELGCRVLNAMAAHPQRVHGRVA